MSLSDIIYNIGTMFGKMPSFIAIKKFKQLFYSGFYGTKFGSCGNKFRISMPIKFINGPQYMYIGDNVCIHPYVRLEAIKTSKDQSPIIKIGDRCALGYNTQINACNRIEIGSDVLFGSNVYITDHYHGNMSIEETSSPPTFVKYIRKVRL